MQGTLVNDLISSSAGRCKKSWTVSLYGPAAFPPRTTPQEQVQSAPPLPRAGDTSDGAPTHVVEHLTLGGAVLLGDGVGHGVGAHEQRVPVVRAEEGQRDQTDGEWEKRFSDAKPVRKELLGLPP